MLGNIDAQSIHWSDDQTQVQAKIGMNWLSWGENLTVYLEESGEVVVQSECSFPLQLIDWGKNKQNCLRFLASLADRLESNPPSRTQW